MTSNIKELFIPYVLAVLAKDFKFNEICLGYYSDIKKLYLTDDENGFKNSNLSISNRIRKENLIAAPTYQQIVDWFRKYHNIEIGSPVTKQKDKGTFYGGYLKRIDANNFGKSYGSNFKTYYSAYDKAIEDAFNLSKETQTIK